MDHFGYLYACLLAAGGLAGYLKAGSLMSLLMGTLTGLGAGVGAYRASANPENVYVGLLVSLLVAARSAKHLGWIYLYQSKILLGLARPL